MKLSNGETKYLKEIGQWVKRHRIRANLTQTDLAKELKVSHQQIHSYESGKNQFPIVMLYRVINALGINDTNYLFKGISYYGKIPEKQRLQGREKIG